MKSLTREQVQGRKDKAARFVRDVLDDPERADEIEDEDLEEYATRRKLRMTNPNRRRNTMPTNKDLRQRIRDLEEENQDLSDQLDQIADIVSPGDEEEDEDEEGNDDRD